MPSGGAQLHSELSEKPDVSRELEMINYLKRENARFKSREAEMLAKVGMAAQSRP
jgi:hypothetical protein